VNALPLPGMAAGVGVDSWVDPGGTADGLVEGAVAWWMW
jgi:hypothetical protein